MRMSPVSVFLFGVALLAAIPAAQAQQPAPAQRQPAAASEPPPEASPNDIDGPTMFATLCGFCHENGGRSAGKGPKLAGNPNSDEYLIERIKKGKQGAMPGFERMFSGGQIIAILAYIRGLEDDGK
jgi:mono/diheme cytochrome c family protein